MGTHEIGGRRAGCVLFTLSDSAVGGGHGSGWIIGFPGVAVCREGGGA